MKDKHQYRFFIKISFAVVHHYLIGGFMGTSKRYLWYHWHTFVCIWGLGPQVLTQVPVATPGIFFGGVIGRESILQYTYKLKLMYVDTDAIFSYRVTEMWQKNKAYHYFFTNERVSMTTQHIVLHNTETWTCQCNIPNTVLARY